MTDKGVAKLGERIAESDHFWLNLSGTNVDGSAFKGWKAAPMWLDLSKTSVDDKFGKTLVAIGMKSPRGMRQLNLASTKVTDAILPELAAFPAIYELNISNTAITSAAILRSGLALHRVVISPGQFTDDEIRQLQSKGAFVTEESHDDRDPWEGQGG